MSKNTVHSWLGKHLDAHVQEQSELLSAQALIASLRPGPSTQLVADIKKVIDRIAPMTQRDEYLRGLATDDRFPGWVRLYVALHTDHADLIDDLSRYTGALTKAVGTTSWTRQAPGLAHLRLARRVQLAAAGVRVDLTLADLEEALPRVATAPWAAREDLAANLAAAVDFDDARFAGTLPRVLALADAGAFGPDLVRHLLVRLAVASDAFAGFKTAAALPVRTFAEAFADADIPPVHSSYDDKLVTNLLGSKTPAHRRLGTALAAANHLRSDDVTVALARSDEGVTVLTGTRLHLRRLMFPVAEVLYRRQRRVTPELVTILRREAEQLASPKYADEVAHLCTTLGHDAWVLAYLAAPTVARSHGTIATIVPPRALRALLAAASWQRPTPAQVHVLELMPELDWEIVDKARAVLIGEYVDADLRFTPAGLLHGTSSHLTDEVVRFLSYGHRSGCRPFDSPEARDAHWGAWLRALPAAAIPMLLVDVAEFRGRTGDDAGQPPALQAFLDEAFTAAGSAAARDALARALMAPSIRSVLPRTMTLPQYAASLGRTVQHHAA